MRKKHGCNDNIVTRDGLKSDLFAADLLPGNVHYLRSSEHAHIAENNGIDLALFESTVRILNRP